MVLKFLTLSVFEAGLRISELAGLKIVDIIWNERGAKIRVSGKTGERVLPIVMAVPTPTITAESVLTPSPAPTQTPLDYLQLKK